MQSMMQEREPNRRLDEHGDKIMDFLTLVLIEVLTPNIGATLGLTLAAWGLFFRKREMSRIKAWGLSLLVAYLFLVLAGLFGILLGLLM